MKISVVIPCYLSEETLREAVDSAAMAFEILVVDDASPGGCADLVRSWNWPNVRVLVHPQNLGLGAARNTGSRAASGDWIAYLDADDAFEPQWHERLTTFLVQAPEATWAYHLCANGTGSIWEPFASETNPGKSATGCLNGPPSPRAHACFALILLGSILLTPTKGCKAPKT